ncbi:MAG: hypothetical protein LAP61_05545 [Acidobacteriia bacterium]|nr:hypothetical protein [Terriglobia bacterium]
MFKSGLEFNSAEDEARHHASSAENLDILARHQKAFDAGMDAHLAGKTGSLFEATLPLLQLQRLVPVENLDRDFLTGETT